MPTKRGDDAGTLRCAILTPRGEGGIAVVAVWGGGAKAAVEARLRGPEGERRRVSAGRLAYGFFMGGGGEQIDEVIVACLSADSVEVNCHGGVVPARRVAGELAAAGARLESVDAAPAAGAGTGRIEAAALDLLPGALTALSARILAAQADGALRRALMDAEHALDAGHLAEASAVLRQLERSAQLGLRLVKPATIAFLGPANAGKSSLVNALAGYERTIVSEVRGTTRDAVRVTVSLDGVPVTLVDTAGNDVRRGEVEAMSLKRGEAAAEAADAAAYVVDASQPLASAAPPGKGRTVVVANKVDLEPLAATMAAVRAWGLPVVETSATVPAGLDRFSEAIFDLIGVPAAALRGERGAVVFTDWQRKAVRTALSALEEGSIRQAQQAISECLA